ncbi:hypothetical protein ACFSJU_01415 [Paradesertivirga mongoliensis]|uniref:Uncharacterized protein n=1 Tax=Paradesertivirga mongoliensis TaxID=2100740 RepID=A0ABW4ZGH2_9SPHI|nr:hypothetical protein [Pedobacter mongoliensis]
MKAKITIITSSQPSLNPRMVKEADALAEHGYDVVVIGQYWNEWASKTDQNLLQQKKWKYIQVGGSPKDNKTAYIITRFIHKAARKLLNKVGTNFGIAELSMGRCSILLYKEALRQKAQLYIGHNPGGLAPAIKAAKKLKVKCGFDAEDFHRKEYSDDIKHPDVLCKTFLEEKYFPHADYLTTASPLISKEYKKIFPNLSFSTVLNVFPKPENIVIKDSKANEPLKLFWFSQTLGHNRGIAEIIEAIGLVNSPLIELHLLANPREKNIAFFNGLAASNNILPHQISYHSPIPSDQLFQYASKFDIGLASETGFNTNNNIALSNKLFTYISSGLAVLYSDTQAQADFMKDYPDCGLVYEKTTPRSLANALAHYLNNREDLNEAKRASFKAGQHILNWETESQKFLAVVQNTLSA